jgi:hypothetical protein
MEGEADATEIVGGLRARGGCPRLANADKEEAGQKSNERDRDKQFDDGEAGVPRSWPACSCTIWRLLPRRAR